MRTDPVCAQPGDFVADVRSQLATQRLVPIVDRLRRPVGMFTRSDLLRPTRRRMVLVDHNEPSQAVAGLEEAEVVGIIDHHRISTIQTPAPILLRCEPVGATATIVAQLYREADIAIPPNIAGLLLAAIVSDTVIFRSPTCTERDRATAMALATIAGLDPGAFGRELFSRAADIRGLSPSRVLTRDFKEFPVRGALYGIAAIETGDTAPLQALRTELYAEMERLRRTRPYELVLCMIVDILQEQTEILICGHAEPVAAAFDRPLLDGPAIVLPYVASRKKQIVPLLDEIDGAIRSGRGAAAG